jgi:putative FmdB family regulatory protein
MLYDYKCFLCHKDIEVDLRPSEVTNELPCPHCGGVLRRVYSAPSIQFKGSGFYSTGG